MIARPLSWRMRWVDWRNRVLANSTFQDWSARLPLLQWVARGRATQMFDLVAGFCYSQVLLAAVESGLLELLARGAHETASVAAVTDLSEAAATRLLLAAASLDLVEEVEPGCWMLGQQGAALQASPGVKAMIRHHRLLYGDLADPLELLRADRAAPTALSQFWRYGATESMETASPYSALMAESQAMVAHQAIAAYPFARHGRLLDIGGGHGAFVTALAAEFPGLDFGIFDLPPVLAGTRKQFEAAGMDGQVVLHPGDFFSDQIPPGFDCITLVRILHDHDDGPCLRLLRSIHAALPGNGRLVVAEPLSETPGARAMGGAYFGLYLWAMGSGRPRSLSEYRALLRKAGFSSVRHVRTPQPLIASVIVGIK